MLLDDITPSNVPDIGASLLMHTHPTSTTTGTTNCGLVVKSLDLDATGSGLTAVTASRNGGVGKSSGPSRVRGGPANDTKKEVLKFVPQFEGRFLLQGKVTELVGNNSLTKAQGRIYTEIMSILVRNISYKGSVSSKVSSESLSSRLSNLNSKLNVREKWEAYSTALSYHNRMHPDQLAVGDDIPLSDGNVMKGQIRNRS